MNKRLTAIIQAEGDGFVALCPELDIASQGDTIEQARDNLRAALELFYECAAPTEIQERLAGEVFVTQVEVTVGKLRVLSGQEVCRILEQHGFVPVRQRSSHIVMQKAGAGTTTTVPVPDHHEVRIGTLRSIIRQSGVPRSEFES